MASDASDSPSPGKSSELPSRSSLSVFHVDSSADGDDGFVIKSGWAVKQSGQKDLFGMHNWRKRWFELKKSKNFAIFSYYARQEDVLPKGSFQMNNQYIARELESDTIKGKRYCFALGPLIDCGLRTYYISCENEDEMLEWILVINSTLEGCKADKVFKRKSTYRIRGRHKLKDKPSSSTPTDTTSGKDQDYKSYEWRLQQWHKLCGIAQNDCWKREDVKNGVSVARQKFNQTDIAYFKISGMVRARPNVVYEYMHRSVNSGGKLDMLFRFEEAFEKIEVDKTTTYFARTEYDVPIPGVKNRDMCYFKMWIPSCSTSRQQSGMLIQSVPHAESKEFVRIDLGLSGLIVTPVEECENESLVVLVVGIDLQDALQNMLRGAFKSGILRGALRRMFLEIVKKVESYNNLLYSSK